MPYISIDSLIFIVFVMFVLLSMGILSLLGIFLFHSKRFAEYALTRFIYLIFSDRK
jgi:hypothetical protein